MRTTPSSSTMSSPLASPEGHSRILRPGRDTVATSSSSSMSAGRVATGPSGRPETIARAHHGQERPVPGHRRHPHGWPGRGPPPLLPAARADGAAHGRPRRLLELSRGLVEEAVDTVVIQPRSRRLGAQGRGRYGGGSGGRPPNPRSGKENRRSRNLGPSGAARPYHRAMTPDSSDQPRPARSPESASSTARRSWPGRTARCSSGTSALTSSRSSHPRVTRPAAGVRRGSATASRDADGRLLPVGQPQQARHPARPEDPGGRRGPAPAARPTPTSWSRTSAPAASPGWASTTTALRASTRGSSTWRSRATDRWARRRPARLRLHRPGRRRPDVDHRRCRRGRRRPDQGRRRDQRHRDRAARGGRRAGALSGASATADRAPARASASTCRSSGRRWRSHQPGAERVRVGGAPRAARQRPPEHRAVRDVRDGRRRDRGRGGPSASGRACARRSGSRTGRRSALRDERRPGREPRPHCARPGRAPSARGPRPTGCGARRSRGPGGPINDVLEAFSSPEARPWACRSSRTPGPRGRSARSGSRSSCSRRPASIRTPPPTTRRAHRRDPRRARLPAGGDRGLRARGVV